MFWDYYVIFKYKNMIIRSSQWVIIEDGQVVEHAQVWVFGFGCSGLS